jgi:hypothetical protein
MRKRQDSTLTRRYSLSMHITPMDRASRLFHHPKAPLYAASSITSSSASHRNGHGAGAKLDSPIQTAHKRSNPVWKLVHTRDAIYAPVPPSLTRKRPALPSACSSASSGSSIYSTSESSSPWYDYDEFNDHSQSRHTTGAGQRSSSPSYQGLHNQSLIHSSP